MPTIRPPPPARRRPPTTARRRPPTTARPPATAARPPTMQQVHCVLARIEKCRMGWLQELLE
jgi:hypothetical protein